jgi:hypothetical protein
MAAMRKPRPTLGHGLRALAAPSFALTTMWDRIEKTKSDSFAFGAEDHPAAVDGVNFLPARIGWGKLTIGNRRSQTQLPSEIANDIQH